ncbi:unnamed protein product [Brassica rapa]|uniref:NAD(P)H dehydrogenase (quinone) n=1 Tax=Brassica campestris TaxID=3711 RepID=A0A8D9I336_BRACM|nr:unnamed protein product [Brassica rapa]
MGEIIKELTKPGELGAMYESLTSLLLLACFIFFLKIRKATSYIFIFLKSLSNPSPTIYDLPSCKEVELLNFEFIWFHFRCGYVYSRFAFVIPFLFTVIGELFHLTSICDSENNCGCINIDEGVPVIGMGVAVLLVIIEKGLTYQEIAKIPLGEGSMRHGQVLEVNGEKAIGQVPEPLPEEALSKMSTPPKSESPIITPNDLAEADGFVFGFPTRYGMMAAQFKVFLHATGGLQRTQSRGPLKDQSAHVYIICDGGNIEGFATKMTEPQPKYSTTEKQVLDML